MFVVIELVAFAVVFLLLMTIARNQIKGETLNKIYLARDTAILVNSLYAVPGDAYVVYPTSTSKYNFDFFDDRVIVYDKDMVPFKKTYFYVKNKETVFDLEFKKPEQLVFYKKDNVVSVTDDLDFMHLFIDSMKKACPDIITKADINEKMIILDPAHGCTKDINNPSSCIYGELGLVEGGIAEAGYMWNIASLVKDRLSKAMLTRNIDEAKTIDKRTKMIEENNADIVISLHLYSGLGDKVRIYMPQTSSKMWENRKLACLVDEALSESFEDLEFETTPTNTIEFLNQNKDRIILQIEFNIKGGIVKDMSKIADYLYAAIKKYYET